MPGAIGGLTMGADPVAYAVAVASVGNVKVDVNELNVDLLSLSGAPLGAPKGIGALYFRKNVRLMPLIHGGIQENGRRAGTENVPGIVGLGAAAEFAREELPEKTEHVRKLRDLLIAGIRERVGKVKLTGHRRRPVMQAFALRPLVSHSSFAHPGRHYATGSACAQALNLSSVGGHRYSSGPTGISGTPSMQPNNPEEISMFSASPLSIGSA
jgi:cysteine desulfurase